MTEKQTRRYIDFFDQLIEGYNNRPHRSIGHMTPLEADKPENESKVSSILRERYAKLLEVKHPVRFKVGDEVRIKTGFGRSFQRGYEEQYSQTLFRVIKINRRQIVPMYHLLNLDTGEELQGPCYANELSLVDNKGIFKVERVIKRRRRHGVDEVLVRWLGWGPAHDSWIPATNIVNTYPSQT